MRKTSILALSDRGNELLLSLDKRLHTLERFSSAHLGRPAAVGRFEPLSRRLRLFHGHPIHFVRSQPADGMNRIAGNSFGSVFASLVIDYGTMASQRRPSGAGPPDDLRLSDGVARAQSDPRRRPRHAAVPADAAPIQASRADRRQVPPDRHPLSELHQQRLTRIYVLTQFLSTSLHRHIANTYNFDMFNRGFVEVLAAQQAER